mmetsp:Transcript_11781/g.21495  ORF Transcript_11781/g.21495 Transcript_11781/m.21495 type:complete len:323 (+) Transcript_11781:218-1186(+)
MKVDTTDANQSDEELSPETENGSRNGNQSSDDDSSRKQQTALNKKQVHFTVPEEMDREATGTDITEEDMAFAKSKIGDAGNIIKVFKPGHDFANEVAFAEYKAMAWFPWCWPHMLLGGPCIYMSASNKENLLNNIFYVITDEGLYTLVRDDYPKYCRAVLAPKSKEYIFTPWDQVLNIKVVCNSGNFGFAQHEYLFIQTPGETELGEQGSSTRENGIKWYVPRCTKVGKTIQKKMKKFRSKANSPARKTLKSFPVYVETAPGQRKMIRINRKMSWDDFRFLVVKSLGIETEKMRFFIGGEGVHEEVFDISALDSGDVLLVEI